MRLLYEPLTDIPVGFKEVEYLEASGTQYINTGYIPNTNTYVEMYAMYTALDSTYRTPFSVRTSDGAANSFTIAGAISTANVYAFGSQYWSEDNGCPDASINVKYFMSLKSGVANFNGVTGNAGTTITPSSLTAYMFARNANGTAANFFKGRIYCCKIFETGVLLHSFVPCLDNNNVPCMYDKIGGKAYYNAGTGSFNVGRKIIPVKYLESTGTQCIDTGIKGKSGISAKTKVNYTYLSGTGSHAIGGEYTTNTSCYFGMVRANGHFTYLYKNSVIETDTTLSINTDYDIDITLNNGNQRFVINGNVVSTGTVSGDFTATNNLFLYAINSVNGADVFGSLKMYYMQIWDNGTLVRDYIPCKDENGVGFMFDKVTHSTYLNAGTGSFVVGKTLPKKKLRLIKESKRRLPKGFKEVEYLESTGTQYINTGVLPTQLTKTKIELQFTNVNYKQAVLGSNNGASGDAGWNNLFGTNENSSTAKPTYFWCQWGNSFDGPVTKDTNRHTHTFERNGDSSWTYTVDNDSKTITSGVSTQTNPKVMYLFACNNNGTTYRQAKAKVYRCQIWNNGTPVRDFIPCLDNNNTPCMYDLVEGKAYYNAGTGSFTYGHTIIPVEYLQSTGTQYVDTGYAFTDDFSWEIDFEGIDENQTIFGGRTQSVRTSVLYQPLVSVMNNTVCTIAGFNAQATPFVLSNLKTGRHNVKMSFKSNKGSVWVDGTQLYNEQTFTGTYISGTTMAVFADNFGSGANPQYQELSNSKVYALKMWQGSTIVRDYIPVKDENNVGYMFDVVTHTLYANAGTGAFVVGNETKTEKTRFLMETNRRLPKGFTEVEYLQSSGTEWIDIGTNINTATDEIEMYFQLTDTANYKWIFGEHDDNARLGLGTGDGSNKRNVAYYNATSKVNDSEMYNSQHYYKVDSSGVYLNGTKIANYASFASTSTLYLFNLNLSSATYMCKGKIWAYRQKRNGVLIRDMIPCLDTNNVPCMYDVVNNQAYYNQGTGTFSYGHMITTIEYIQSTGAQYINVGVKAKSTLKTDIYFEVVDKTQGGHIFGGRTVTSGGRGYGVYLPTTGGIGFDYETRLSSNVSTTNGYKYRVVKDGASNILYVNGVQSYTGNNTAATFDLNVDMALFYMKDINTSFNASVRCKVFYFKIFDNNALVRDFIPVKDENNVGYMFDKVSHALYANAGTGSFIIG